MLAGDRFPVAALPLKWSGIYWYRNRVRITAPNTEHDDGVAEWVIPLWPELRKTLLELFEQTEDGQRHVITRYRQSNANLRTQARRIIQRAGRIPWPKVLQNLRGTRQTELAMDYPNHQVCRRHGNASAVAMDHDLQVWEEDSDVEAGGASRGNATRKTTRLPLELLVNQKQHNGDGPEKPVAQSPKIAALIAKFRAISDPDRTQKTPPRGGELLNDSHGKTAHWPACVSIRVSMLARLEGFIQVIRQFMLLPMPERRLLLHALATLYSRSVEQDTVRCENHTVTECERG